jgi:hypothetical protein
MMEKEIDHAKTMIKKRGRPRKNLEAPESLTPQGHAVTLKIPFSKGSYNFDLLLGGFEGSLKVKVVKIHRDKKEMDTEKAIARLGMKKIFNKISSKLKAKGYLKPKSPIFFELSL